MRLPLQPSRELTKTTTTTKNNNALKNMILGRIMSYTGIMYMMNFDKKYEKLKSAPLSEVKMDI